MLGASLFCDRNCNAGIGATVVQIPIPFEVNQCVTEGRIFRNAVTFVRILRLNDRLLRTGYQFSRIVTVKQCPSYRITMIVDLASETSDALSEFFPIFTVDRAVIHK